MLEWDSDHQIMYWPAWVAFCVAGPQAGTTAFGSLPKWGCGNRKQFIIFIASFLWNVEDSRNLTAERVCLNKRKEAWRKVYIVFIQNKLFFCACVLKMTKLARHEGHLLVILLNQRNISAVLVLSMTLIHVDVPVVRSRACANITVGDGVCYSWTHQWMSKYFSVATDSWYGQTVQAFIHD